MYWCSPVIVRTETLKFKFDFAGNILKNYEPSNFLTSRLNTTQSVDGRIIVELELVNL